VCVCVCVFERARDPVRVYSKGIRWAIFGLCKNKEKASSSRE
jgi:hypothetical protein